MTYPASNDRSLRLTLFLMLALGAGCASKNDALSGSGGTGGTTQSGGAPGTGGATGDGGGNLQSLLAAAQAEWAQAKTSCSAYSYNREVSSVFGFCAVTTVAVSSDVVSSRGYVAGDSGCPPTPDGGITENWSESGAQVGTHTDGAPAETVEQLFAECQSILALDPSQYSFALTIGFLGIPVTCKATLKQCADDCTTGIQINEFSCAVTAG